MSTSIWTLIFIKANGNQTVTSGVVNDVDIDRDRFSPEHWTTILDLPDMIVLERTGPVYTYRYLIEIRNA